MRDTLATAAIQDLHIRTLLRSHGEDDGFDVFHFFAIKVDVLQLVFEFAHARKHPEDALEGSQLSHLFQLVQEIVKGEFPFTHLRRCVFHGFFIHISLGCLNQRSEVAQVEDTAGHTVRIEILKAAVKFFGYTDHLDRLAGDGLDGERCTASGVAIHLRQDGAVDAQIFIESFGGIHGVLTGHGVKDEKDLMRMDLCFDVAKLSHQLFIDREPACGIEDDDITVVCLGGIDRVLRDVDRIHIRRHAVDRDIRLLAQNLELLDRCRTIDVAGCHHRTVAFFLEHQSELAGRRRLAGALQADQHDDRHAGGRQSDLALCPAQKLCQLVFDDLDDRLVRLQAAEDLFPHRLFTDVSDEIFRHLEIDIGF